MLVLPQKTGHRFAAETFFLIKPTISGFHGARFVKPSTPGFLLER
ncbi:hypothetical protein HMPREF3293_01692 [Christensenella minuta]|uniref:Uncharacterized protein n=1 Tax=Christensenella minuta TaxID=626937 RepID=A0A136Q462_9FIRM|nr:hypothetical protein HMPREF3293_01692 [Christensenella minuta]